MNICALGTWRINIQLTIEFSRSSDFCIGRRILACRLDEKDSTMCNEDANLLHISVIDLYIRDPGKSKSAFFKGYYNRIFDQILSSP
jgi:hypothetical protein